MKTQIWCAIAASVLIAIAKKSLMSGGIVRYPLTVDAWSILNRNMMVKFQAAPTGHARFLMRAAHCLPFGRGIEFQH